MGTVAINNKSHIIHGFSRIDFTNDIKINRGGWILDSLYYTWTFYFWRKRYAKLICLGNVPIDQKSHTIFGLRSTNYTHQIAFNTGVEFFSYFVTRRHFSFILNALPN